MDSTDEDIYCQKLDELIYDEDKIVTGPLVAMHFRIPIQEAKAVVKKYITDHRQLKPDDLAVTYLLSGTQKDGHSLGLCLVLESELNAKKELFEIVTSEDVYSIQKAKNIDFGAVALAGEIGNELLETIISSAPVGKNCIQRNIKVRKLPPVEAKTVKEKPSFFAKVPPKNKSEDVKPAVEKPTTSKESAVPSSQPKSQKPKPAGGIASFFSKAAAKPNDSSKNGPSNSQKENIDKNKSTEVDVKKEEKAPSQDEINGEAMNGIVQNEDTVTSRNVTQEEPMQVESNGTPPKQQTKSEKNKKRKKENKTNDVPTKRRKRIQQICDSDSDDMFDDEENDIIEKSDEEPEPPPVIKSPVVLKNKTRKAVDKTYMDEDGYIVTKTEYVFESASEDEKGEESVKEEANPVKKEEEKPGNKEEKPKAVFEKKNSTTDSENEVKKGATAKGKKNAKKPPTSGRQPTLMSFFKKA